MIVKIRRAKTRRNLLVLSAHGFDAQVCESVEVEHSPMGEGIIYWLRGGSTAERDPRIVFVPHEKGGSPTPDTVVYIARKAGKEIPQA